jgi:transglutaminase-like putative cysteine protease
VLTDGGYDGALSELDPRATAAGSLVDADHPAVAQFVRSVAGAATGIRAVELLFAAVRDHIRYQGVVDYSKAESYRASSVLKSSRGFCIGKAALLAACVRLLGIPAALGFADVRNHLASPKLRALIGGDLVVWHGYTKLFVHGRWFKLSPAFDRDTCEKFGTVVLEFDGTNDALLQQCDLHGRQHMEYVRSRGTYYEPPVELLAAEFRLHHPQLWAVATEQSPPLAR